jgi:hypothetical protein
LRSRSCSRFRWYCLRAGRGTGAPPAGQGTACSGGLGGVCSEDAGQRGYRRKQRGLDIARYRRDHPQASISRDIDATTHKPRYREISRRPPTSLDIARYRRDHPPAPISRDIEATTHQPRYREISRRPSTSLDIIYGGAHIKGAGPLSEALGVLGCCAGVLSESHGDQSANPSLVRVLRGSIS